MWQLVGPNYFIANYFRVKYVLFPIFCVTLKNSPYYFRDFKNIY